MFRYTPLLDLPLAPGAGPTRQARHPFSKRTNNTHATSKLPSSSIIDKRSSEKQLPSRVNRGSWNRQEQVDFLEAMLLYGDRDWVKVASVIPSRTTTQVRSHAQHVLNKIGKGCDVFLPLREARNPRYFEALCAIGEAHGINLAESNPGIELTSSPPSSDSHVRSMIARVSPTHCEWEAALSLLSIGEEH